MTKEEYFKEDWINGLNLPEIKHERNFLPEESEVLKSLTYFLPKDTRVIILGQDPYPQRENATGLAFSVEHSNIPSTLRNILMECFEDTGALPPETGNLEGWAKQGVLLLNRVLTVREGRSDSHATSGWKHFTNQLVLRAIDESPALALILWGNSAQGILKDLPEIASLKQVAVLIGGHPSPLNRAVPFRGGRYFSRANLHLAKNGLEPIDWRLRG